MYMQDAQAVRACLGLLRQLANSDAIKASIVEASGLELINQAVSCHSTSAGLPHCTASVVLQRLYNPMPAPLCTAMQRCAIRVPGSWRHELRGIRCRSKTLALLQVPWSKPLVSSPHCCCGIRQLLNRQLSPAALTAARKPCRHARRASRIVQSAPSGCSDRYCTLLSSQTGSFPMPFSSYMPIWKMAPAQMMSIKCLMGDITMRVQSATMCAC